jgi:hypothetical protein
MLGKAEGQTRWLPISLWGLNRIDDDGKHDQGLVLLILPVPWLQLQVACALVEWVWRGE